MPLPPWAERTGAKARKAIGAKEEICIVVTCKPIRSNRRRPEMLDPGVSAVKSQRISYLQDLRKDP